MAGGAIIGALRVVIGADSAALDKGLKDAQSSISRFSTGLKNVGLIAAGALAGVAGGAAVAIRSALKDADQLGKLAQSIGIPVEELSKLKFAAELSDISLESLGKSVVKLSRNMSEVAGGNTTGAAAQAFKVLGISVRDASGQVKSSDTILAEVADRFASYRDGANKTALAVALFGRAGAEMIPLLNQGSAAIRAAKEEAEQFGLVIDSRTAAAAENFNDNLTRLGKVAQGVSVQIAARLAPALAQMTDSMVESAKGGDIANRAVEGFQKIVTGAAKVAVSATLVFRRLGAELSALWNVISSIGSGGFSEAWEAFKAAGAETQRQLESLPGLMQQIESVGASAFQSLGSSSFQWAAALSASNDAIRDAIGIGQRFLDQRKTDAPALPAGDNALQQYLSGIEKRKAALTAELQTIGMSEAAQESLKVKLEALTIAKEKDIQVTDAMRAKIDQAAASFGQLSQALQEARQRWQFVDNSISTVASGLTDIVMGAKSASEAFREMALSIIRDFTQMIIKATLFRGLTSFMGGGFGGGLGGGIPGLALPGFANGGSFVVGGAGGIDSQITAMRTTPGERVTVTKDGSMPGGGGTTIIMNNDFRGTDPSQRAWIDGRLAILERKIRTSTPADVSRYRYDNPNFLQGNG